MKKSEFDLMKPWRKVAIVSAAIVIGALAIAYIYAVGYVAYHFEMW